VDGDANGLGEALIGSRSAAMLHFAYGSNMHRPVMRKHAPAAVALGFARLDGHRFIITADGYASVAPHPRACVHGLLWRLTARDRVTLDRWENTAAGLYRAQMLAVIAKGKKRPALVYVARGRQRGVPRPGYMEIVLRAARECGLPADYIASLQRWLPKQQLASGHRNFGDCA
jgi:cation transport regulator ChaC